MENKRSGVVCAVYPQSSECPQIVLRKFELHARIFQSVTKSHAVTLRYPSRTVVPGE